MLKDTKSLGNNKAPACESRGFVHKKRGVHFDTPPSCFMLLSGKMGSADFHGWWSRGFQEYSLASLNMKKPMSPTPLKCVRRALMRIFPVGELSYQGGRQSRPIWGNRRCNDRRGRVASRR